MQALWCEELMCWMINDLHLNILGSSNDKHCSTYSWIWVSGCTILVNQVPSRRYLPVITSLFFHVHAQSTSDSEHIRSEYNQFYFLGGQNKSRSGMTLIVVHDRTLVVLTFSFDFLVFGLLSTAHRYSSCKIGSSFFVDGFERKAVRLTFRSLMILIVLH